MKKLGWAIFGLVVSVWFAGNVWAQTPWTRTVDTSAGPVDLTHVTSIEFHADVWNYGYTFWVDGLFLGGVEVTENNASQWGTFGDRPGTVTNDTTDFKVGTASIKLYTASGFDSGCFYPGSRTASWDLSKTSSLSFWMKFQSPNPIQFNSPWIVLTTASGGKVTFTPGSNLLTTSWTQITLPLNNVTLTVSPSIGNAPLACMFYYNAWYPQNIVQYQLYLNGDGVVSGTQTTAGSTSWSYNTPGTYMATLRATDLNGTVWTAMTPVQVQPPLQGITLSASPRDGTAPMTVNFQFGALNTNITQYQLDAKGVGVIDYTSSTAGTFSYTFSNPGYYMAKLTGTDTTGKTWTQTLSINAFAPGKRPEYVMRPRVVVVAYNPWLTTQGKSLFNYESDATRVARNDPMTTAQQIRQDFLVASGGFVDIQIVDVINRNEFPPELDGSRFTEQTYLTAFSQGKGYAQWAGAMMDQVAMVRENMLDARVKADQVDEVWLFGSWYYSMNESYMAGPGSFGINGPNFPTVDSGRAFAIMGWENRVGVPNSVHSVIHRVENTLDNAYYWCGAKQGDPWAHYRWNANMDPTFVQGPYGVGDAHDPPNATHEYDYTNVTNTVLSTANDWYNYPNLTGATTYVNATAWGATDIGYYIWWFSHLPKVPGTSNRSPTSTDQRQNNWWKYIFDISRYPELVGASNALPVASITNPTGDTSTTFTSFTFTGYGTPGANPVAQLIWNFGDGSAPVVDAVHLTSSNPSSVTHTFPGMGNYTVTLVAVDSTGTQSSPVSVETRYVQISTPTLSGPSSGDAGSSYTFWASTTTGNAQVKFVFNWGDGTSTTTGWVASGAWASASHTWIAEGTYTVTVQATDSNGLVSTSSVLTVQMMEVLSVPTVSGSSGGAPTTTGNAGTAYTYQVSATTLYGNAQVHYVVNWGDGTTTTTGWLASGTTTSVTHTWNAAGTYVVTVQAIDSYGQVSTSSFTVQMTGTADLTVSDVYIPNYVAPGGTLTLLEAVSNIGGTGTGSFSVSYTLSGGGTGGWFGSPVVGGLASPVTLGSIQINSLAAGATDFKSVQMVMPSTLSDGTYTLTITADSGNVIPETNKANNVLSRSINVVTNRFPMDINGDNWVNLTDLSMVASSWFQGVGSIKYDPRNDISGDGVVDLIDLSLVAQYFGVNVTKPVAKLSITPGYSSATIATGQAITLTYGYLTTKVTVVQHTLDFGDGSTVLTSSTPGNVSHTYAAGNYTAKLTVTDSTGQTSMASVNVAVVNFSTAAPTLSASTSSSYLSVSLSWPTGGSSPFWQVYRNGVFLTTVTNSRSYVDTSVQNWTSYSYTVQAASNSSGSSIGVSSNVVSVMVNSGPPFLAQGSVGSFSFGLSWSPTPPGSVSIERSSVLYGTNFSVITTTSGTSYTDNTVAPGVTYYYRIRFTDGQGQYGPYSTTVSGVTPGVSLGLSAAATAGQTNSATLTWNPTAPSGGCSTLIERSVNGGSFVQIASVWGGNGSYVDLGALAGSSYSYRVRFGDSGGGYGSYSNTAAATPTAGIVPVLSATGYPLISAVGLSWSPLNSSSYPYASVELQDPTQSAFAVLNTTSQVAMVQGGMVAGTSYQYRMRFLNASATGASNYSATVTFMTPAPVLSASGNGTGSVTLTISGTTSPYFMVYRSTDGVNFSYVGFTGSMSYTNTGLTSGTTYYYYVKSWSGGQPSNIITITAP